MTSEEYLKSMVEILKKKYDLLKEILDLSRSQTYAITDEEFETLEKLIHGKQTVINCIEPLDERFNALFLELKTRLDIKSMEQLNNKNIHGKKDLKEATSKILEIVAEISLIEKQNNEMMQKLMKKSKKEIKNIVQGKKALSAYISHPFNSPSYYIDKKK
ncbi:MAG TPA: flagellar protein FlgN [Clostridiales bacterium]|nr:flagellar protein FlgN [Clostridiales bacterium]